MEIVKTKNLCNTVYIFGLKSITIIHNEWIKSPLLILLER
jgi:hypothetical protein